MTEAAPASEAVRGRPVAAPPAAADDARVNQSPVAALPFYHHRWPLLAVYYDRTRSCPDDHPLRYCPCRAHSLVATRTSMGRNPTGPSASNPILTKEIGIFGRIDPMLNL